MNIREKCTNDDELIWEILKPVFRVGDTYALPCDITRKGALDYWLKPEHRVFVAEFGNNLYGTYYLRANQQGGGSHVANCGYIVNPSARGRGIAKLMCLHSIEVARQEGFLAMQFNFVVSTNKPAIKIWESLEFNIVGRIPKAFAHPSWGHVDVFIMHRFI